MGRMEILTGVERGRDGSDEEKLSILQEAAEPDAKIADVARRRDIRTKQIYTWRRKFATEQAEPVASFLSVALIATGTSDEAEHPTPTDKPSAAIGTSHADRDRLQRRPCLKGRGQHCA